MEFEPDLSEILLANISAQFKACDELERVSDELPNSNTHEFLLSVERICPLLLECHRFEEAHIHPLVAKSRPEIGVILARLHDEHIEDQDQADLLLDNVRTFVSDAGRTKATEVGYVARGLFISLRRHLAFDRHFITPIVRDCIVEPVN